MARMEPDPLAGERGAAGGGHLPRRAVSTRILSPPDRDQLWDLVRRYESEPSRRAELLAEIDRMFRRTASVLAVDTWGFTRRVRGQGPVDSLAVLLNLQAILHRAAESSDGSLIIREGDNFFAVFPDPSAAIRCGRALVHETRRENEARGPGDQLAVSIGIGHGPLLIAAGQPPIGEEMNLACKIGEDVAGPGEVLLTRAAREALDDPALGFEGVSVTLSGIEIHAYRLVVPP